jgi:hypothetical protein
MPTVSKAEPAFTVSGAPWLALLKFSHGDWNVSAAERDSLLARGLIEKKGAATVLTPRGRQALGLEPPPR